MNIKDIPIAKSDERGLIYDCGKIRLVVRKKDSVGAGHSHPEGEDMFLIEGKAELTVGKETKKVKAFTKIEIPPNTYHKIVALTDIKLLYYFK